MSTTTALGAGGATEIPARTPRRYLVLFLISGFPALLYQITWERALFTIYGVNVQSVTMIVTIFMLGLGLGSLAGGWLSARRSVRPVLAFGCIELSVGVFGLVSLPLFHRVGSLTAGASLAATGVLTFALLMIPTFLMGSTLPLLTEDLARGMGNVGESVGWLYSVNAFGSGVACLLAAMVLMRTLGESGVVWLAASLNTVVGVSAVLLAGGSGMNREGSARENVFAAEADERVRAAIPLWVGGVLAGIVGFVALGYEILWFRLYSFTTASAAPTFAQLLGFYLLGIAYGSFAVKDATREKLRADGRKTLEAGANVVILGTTVAFLLAPVLARSVVHIPYEPTFTLVFVAAALLGAAFPLLAHSAMCADRYTGRNLSVLYLSNIAGSAAGSFLVGFVLLDRWPLQEVAMMLAVLGGAAAVAFAFLAGRAGRMFVVVCAACIVAVTCSGWLYSGLYERLLYKGAFHPGMTFASVVENKSGVITVDPEGIVYGSGAYDGRFSTSLVHDTNIIVRAYAVAGLRPQAAHVLVIGLSSGSWVQVVANNPKVQDVTVVEINPGYLPLIEKQPEVASLLKNRKVHIVIDDGRRWLEGHPDRKFDFILMNTTWNWRSNVSNLLSVEFLRILRAHMNPGAAAFYNTTWSERALFTGASEFPYALRFVNFIAVSDAPLVLDKAVWRERLSTYVIDGTPVFDLNRVDQRGRMETVLGMTDRVDFDGSPVESRDHLLRRLAGTRAITDDNMGTEWGQTQDAER